MANPRVTLLNKVHKAIRSIVESDESIEIFQINFFDDFAVVRFDELKKMNWNILEPLAEVMVKNNIDWKIEVNDHSHELELHISLSIQ